MHISTLYLTSDKAPATGFSIYVIVDESDRTVKLFHPSTLSTIDISHLEFRGAREQELWPNPYDSDPRSRPDKNEPAKMVPFPEQVARMIERRIKTLSTDYQATIVRRVLAALRGLKLEQVPPLKDSSNSKPRGFAVRSEKRPGVIDAIRASLENPKGVSVDEILADLQKQFPERTIDGMRTTVRCQINRLPGKLGRTLQSRFDTERGKVYQWASAS